MTRVLLKGLWSRKRRLFGVLTSVLLGVAFLSGTQVLGDTLAHAIDASFTTAYQGTDVVVRNATPATDTISPRGPIDGALVGRIGSVPGVRDAEGQVQGFGEIAGADGKGLTGNGPRVAGTWPASAALNPWKLAEGHAPNGPDEVVIDRNSAKLGKLHPGDVTTVYTPQPIRVTVAGTATYAGQDTNGGTSYVAFTLAGAQRHLLGGRDQVTSISVGAAPGIPAAELQRRIAQVLPAEVQAITGSQLTAEQLKNVNDSFLSFFRIFLGIFAGIALLVAGLSIYNTLSIVAAQRVRETALLRAVGASRRQVLVSGTAEALVIGVVGSVLGIVAGLGVGAGLKAAFAASGAELPAAGLVVTPVMILVGLVVGVGVTLFASLRPAWRAAKVAPVAAIRAVAVEHEGTSRTRVVIGLIMAIAGGGLVGTGSMPLVGFGALLTLAGVVVLGPVVAGWPGRLLGTRVRGVPARMAGRNVARNARRTAGAAAALMIGVVVVTLFTVFAASLKASTTGNLEARFTGDVVVSTTGFAGAGFSPQVAALLAAQPGVRTAAGVGQGSALIGGTSQSVTIGDPAQLSQVFTVQGRDGLAVSSTTADSRHWRIGQSVPVTFEDGTTTSLRIGQIYQPIQPLGGYLIPASVWARHTAQQLDTAVYMKLAPGASPIAAFKRLTAPFGGLTVSDRAAYLKLQTSGIDQLLGIVYAMLALAVIIALLGITNTLSLSVHERTREIGLLRAVGASRRQLRAMVRWESALTAVLGTALGVALGVFLGWGLVTAAGSAQGVGVFSLPYGRLVAVLVVGLLAGILAAVRPARRAARLDVLAAIATE